ncbi:hypothetical protein GGX14DRAFT_563824 [Mycena pura]|uniref:SWIM-type domain-containing protein n=1 Tax=Mycena pura TaxID=153505 RepID=A0AAD6VHY3_9AGAR|nr:hypothetical protein GGX14DRAFT_563824 [Mycena pura]
MDKIKLLASPKLIEYLTTFYMTNEVMRMWSAIYRKARSILEACNTNMPIEAWHHVLKGKFLKHKRNHRINHLLHTLIREVIPYFSLRQRRQDGGFEGQDVEVAKRAEIETEGATYVKEDIEHVHKKLYLVILKSRLEHQYEVDIAMYTCTCREFPLIKYCKHIAAVQHHFKEVFPSLPLLSHCESVQQESDSSADDLTPSSSANSSISSATNPAASVTVPQPPTLTQVATVPQPPTLTQVAMKLERAAARMRRPGLKPGAVPSLDILNSRLDSVLEETDDSGVLPSSQGMRRNTNDWHETKESENRLTTRFPLATRSLACGHAFLSCDASHTPNF